MSEPTHEVDASNAPADAQLQKPFPAPSIPVVDRPGDGGEDLPERAPSPRDEAIDSIIDSYQARVQEEISEQTAEDIAAAGMPLEEGVDQADDESLPVQPPEPGLESQQAMHPTPSDNSGLPPEAQQSPLADHIVMQNGVPHVQLNVNGNIILKPLNDVIAAEQSMAAANERHRENAAWQRQLEAREHALRSAEQQQLMQPASARAVAPPPNLGVDDEKLTAQAKEAVAEIFQGDEDTAAEKLVAFARNLAQPQGPQVDPNQIAAEAAARARRELAEDQYKGAIQAGWEQFKMDFPDIATNPGLLNYCDGLTDAIEMEHPDWTPTMVMAEAGRKTRAWMDGFKSPTPAENPLVDRQQRKQELKPLPRPMTATQQPAPEQPAPTPSDYLDEVRAARGQAV